MEDSLVVEEGILVKFPSVPFATCLLHLQFLLPGSFHQEDVKQPHCGDSQRSQIMILWGLLSHQITSLTTGRVFATSTYWAKSTIEKIILNLNM